LLVAQREERPAPPAPVGGRPAAPRARSEAPPARGQCAELPLSRTLALAVQRRALDPADHVSEDALATPPDVAPPADSSESLRKSLKALKADDVYNTLRAVIASRFITVSHPSHWHFASDFQGWSVQQTFLLPKGDIADPDRDQLGLTGQVSTFRPNPLVSFGLETTEEVPTYDPKTKATSFRRTVHGRLRARGEAPLEKPGLEGIKAAAEQAISNLYQDYENNAALQWVGLNRSAQEMAEQRAPVWDHPPDPIAPRAAPRSEPVVDKIAATMKPHMHALYWNRAERRIELTADDQLASATRERVLAIAKAHGVQVRFLAAEPSWPAGSGQLAVILAKD
jgi:hypothetical protein